jgi:hypothetical protein
VAARRSRFQLILLIVSKLSLDLLDLEQLLVQLVKTLIVIYCIHWRRQFNRLCAYFTGFHSLRHLESSLGSIKDKYDVMYACFHPFLSKIENQEPNIGSRVPERADMTEICMVIHV